MDTSSTVFKALDVLTIVTAREEGVSLPDLALALNQPRSNIVRIVRTLQHYGFVACKGHQWIATSTFRAWSSPSNRHVGFRDLYRPVLETLASATGELVTLGLHEGNGILNIGAIHGVDRSCPVPASGIRHSLRFSAMGKLALSRRADLAIRFPDLDFQQEIDEIRRTGVAWVRGSSTRSVVSMAIPGFSNLPTEPMLAVFWPESRFNQEKAEQARHAAAEAMATSVHSTNEPEPWARSVPMKQLYTLRAS